VHAADILDCLAELSRRCMLIIPTYNERQNIAPLIVRVRKAATEEGILFIDDKSPDGTADEIRRIQRNDPRVHLLARSGKDGYGSACRAGIRKVLDENLDDHLIQFDADLSHPPELLPRMLEMLKSHDVVIGSRYTAGGGSRNWSLPRKTLSFGANLYARLLTGVPAHDMTAGFVGYRAEVLRGLDLGEIRSNGYAFLMEMKFNLHLRGARFGEFPIVFAEREAGKSKFNRRIMLEGVRFPPKAFLRRLGLRRSGVTSEALS
jgi:dolichol-phosphate mannosyltransferase